MNREIAERFCNILGKDRVLLKEPMKSHTTFRIGGPADYYLLPQMQEQVAELVQVCQREQLPYFILGNGSNLLVSDKGFRGAVIQIFKNMSEITAEGICLRAQAGALLSLVSHRAMELGLTGFEFAGGIPGTMGGAAVMNAGAYGGELKDVLEEVTVVTPEGELRVIPASELAMGYRTSLVKQKGYIVVEALIRLQPGDKDAIRERMKELSRLRISKQPLEYPSAGSTFKRPEGYFAGKLIMDAGLRGYRVGDAQVSEKHCGFVINTGQASAEEVRQLMEDVIERVQSQFGVTLEPEVRFLGEF
ncbi:MAG: UDP-N-acetylmuramate dehydrogenase [Eubacteriales bacterium]|nr:UDP-N-acetylmuramate dehydrogenase [Eubacteriales bacterium]